MEYSEVEELFLKLTGLSFKTSLDILVNVMILGFNDSQIEEETCDYNPNMKLPYFTGSVCFDVDEEFHCYDFHVLVDDNIIKSVMLVQVLP